jgi:hypothetical protein
MSKVRKFLVAGVLAFATAAPISSAQAGPLSAPLTVEKASDVENVRCHRWGCRRGWRHRHWHGRRHWHGPRVWVAPRVVIRPAPRYVVRRGYNAHVRWCLNRYASYNPRTDTFLSYDGYYKRCNSPYR